MRLGLIILLMVCFQLYSLDSTSEIRVELDRRAIGVIIDCDKSMEGWRSYTGNKTAEFIKAMESYLDHPFPGPDEFSVVGREIVRDRDEDSENFGKRVGGANFWDSVGIEYGLSEIGKPGLLLHELAHYWYGYSERFGADEVSWLIEGMVSFIPLALKDSEFLNLDVKEYRSIFNHWGFVHDKNSMDLPMNRDFRWDSNDHFGLYYSKSFKLVYLIYKELGKRVFREFSKMILVRDISTNQDIINILKSVKSISWGDLFYGWVIPSEYKTINIEEFTHGDGDSLLSVEEYYLKTNPYNSDSDGDLLPDDFEIDKGLNPLIETNSTVVVKSIESYAPFPDGSFREWEYLPYVSSKERRGEVQRGDIDISGLYYTLRGERFVVFIETVKPPVIINNTMFDLLVDFDGDRKSEREFAFFMDGHYSWVYDHETSSSTILTEIRGRIEDGAEILIPLELIGRDEFYILPIFHNLDGGFNYDEWDRWERVDVKTLKAVNRYSLKTNLKDDDYDRDLIPDIYELTHDLNPVKKDSRAILLKSAPFVDGRGEEWEFINSDVDIGNSEDINRGYSLKRIETFNKGDTLYIMAEVLKPEGKHKDIMFDILFDLNGDNSHDVEVAYMMDNPDYHWFYNVSEARAYELEDIILKVGDVIEVAIPHKYLKGESVTLLPIIRDIKKGINIIEFSKWIKVK